MASEHPGRFPLQTYKECEGLAELLDRLLRQVQGPARHAGDGDGRWRPAPDAARSKANTSSAAAQRGNGQQQRHPRTELARHANATVPLTPTRPARWR